MLCDGYLVVLAEELAQRVGLNVLTGLGALVDKTPPGKLVFSIPASGCRQNPPVVWYVQQAIVIVQLLLPHPWAEQRFSIVAIGQRHRVSYRSKLSLMLSSHCPNPT